MKYRTFTGKKSILLLALLLVLFQASLSSYAETDVFAYKDFYDEAEFTEIVDLVSKRSGVFSLSSILGQDGNDLKKLSFAYKIHYLKNGDILPLADPDRNLMEGIEEEYRWVLITDSAALIEISKKSGSWEVSTFTEPAGVNAPSNRVRLDMLKEAISPLTANDIIVFQAQLMRDTVFVYVLANEGDFLIPFSVRPDFTEMKNGRLYTREEISRIVSTEYEDAIKILREYSAGNSVTENDRIGGGGQSSTNSENKKISPGIVIIIVSSCALLFGIILLTALLIKNKKH